jgi:hypothetical protein
MNATDLQDALYNAIESIAEDARDEIKRDDDDLTLADIVRDIADEFDGIASVRTYQREQMLTTDAGLVVRAADGAEFQITIVQSRRGRD